MPLCDASGAACLIPPPSRGVPQLCAVLVQAQPVGGWRDVLRADMSAVSALCQLRFFGAHVRRCVAASLACDYSGRGTPAMVCVNSVNRITATECDV